MEAFENVEVPKTNWQFFESTCFIQKKKWMILSQVVYVRDLALYSFGYEGIKFIIEIRMVFGKVQK